MSGRELYEKIISELVTKNSVKASKSITRLLSNQKDLDNSNFNKIFKKRLIYLVTTLLDELVGFSKACRPPNFL